MRLDFGLMHPPEGKRESCNGSERVGCAKCWISGGDEP